MKVEIKQNINFYEYDDFINKNKSSSFYHSKNHILFLKDLLKIEPYFIQVKENDDIVGVMPFFLKKSKFGIVINSLPFFGSYGGIVKKEKCEKLILDELNNFNQENDVLSSVIIPSPFIQDESLYENFFSYSFKEPRLIQSLNLTNKSEEGVWHSFEQRIRRAIRKSQQLNIQVSRTELTNDVLDDFYQMHKKQIQAKGGKTKPVDFFTTIKNHFILNRDYEVLCANHNGKNISYLLTFYYNDFAEYYMPAYDSISKNTQSTSLLIWYSIQSALKRQIHFYNFGGTWKNQPELYRFKRGWNSDDLIYNYYIYCDLDRIKEIGIQELSKHYEFFYIIPYEKII